MSATINAAVQAGGDIKDAAVVSGHDNHVTFNVNHAAAAQTLRPKRDLPWLLPYLTDRGRQVGAIATILKQLAPPARPNLFLVYGDDQQCQDMLLSRLETMELPKQLSQVATDTGIIRHHLPWPEDLDRLDQFPDRFVEVFSNVVHGSDGAAYWNSPEEINTWLKGFSAPVMLTTVLLEDVWRQHNGRCLDAFLDFWKRWPPLGQNQRLFIFLAVKYVIRAPQKPASFLSRWFGGQKNIVEPVKEEDVCNAVKSIEHLNWGSLKVHVLPKLGGVARSDVENWARSFEVRKHGAISELLIKAIGEIYRQNLEQNQSDCLPMEKLATLLNEILQKDEIFGG